MDYKLLNELLNDLSSIRSNKNLKHIERTTNDEGYTVEYYKVLSEDNLYIELREQNDSYSNSDYVVSIKFVKAKEVQKIEYINID